MTSEALITKLTQPFTLMPSSSTASLVIEDVRIFPPMSTRTCEVVAFLEFDYDAPDVVACTDAHGDLPSIFSRSRLQPEQTGTSPLGARLHRETDIALCMFGGNQIIRSAAVPMTA